MGVVLLYCFLQLRFFYNRVNFFFDLSYSVSNDEQLSDNGIWGFSLKHVVPMQVLDTKLGFAVQSSGFGLISRVILLHIRDLIRCWQPQQTTPKMH